MFSVVCFLVMYSTYSVPLSSSYLEHSEYFPPQVHVHSSLSPPHHWASTHVLEATLPTPACLAQMLLVSLQPGVDQPSNVFLQTK